jgi:hypothetical protein
MKRCPNGSRRNKSTKKCEPKNKSTSKNKSAKKSTSRKCSKGVPLPPHRIENIIKMEKQMASVLEEQPGPEYYKRMEKYLEGLCFPRDTNWASIYGFSAARHNAINA